MLGFLYLKGSVAGLEYPNGYFLVNLWQGLNYWRTILSKKQKDERYRDKEWLEEKYVGEELTMEEIGSLCGIHRKTIRYWFKKFGIQSGNNRKYEGKNNPRWKDSKCKDKEWLVQKYSIERLTLKDISLLCGVSECVVGRYLKKFGVSAVNEMRKYMGKEYNSGKWLYQKYIIGRSQASSGANINCAYSSKDWWTHYMVLVVDIYSTLDTCWFSNIIWTGIFVDKVKEK